VKELILFTALVAQLPPSFAPDVSVVPELALVPLAAEAREVRVMVRNLAVVELEQLRLEPVADVLCAVAVQPERIVRLSPSDRGTFTVRFSRTEASGKQRFPVEFRLTGQGGTDLPGLRLLVDAGRAESSSSEGWLDVGVVKIGDAAPASRAWALGVLALVPVVLLLLLGWRLKRKAAE